MHRFGGAAGLHVYQRERHQPLARVNGRACRMLECGRRVRPPPLGGVQTADHQPAFAQGLAIPAVRYLQLAVPKRCFRCVARSLQPRQRIGRLRG